jgi:hypothetical protein
MSYSLMKTCSGVSGLIRVQYELIDSAGTVVIPLTASGVAEIVGIAGDSEYRANVAVPDGFVGTIHWVDDAATPTIDAFENIYPETKEDIDAILVAISNISGIIDFPTVEEIRTEMDSNSAKLAMLDATVSSRAAQSTADSIYGDMLEISDIPTVVAIRSEIDSNSTKLDVAVSSRASQATADAIATAVGNLPTVAQIRTEMDSNSADLNSILSLLGTISGYIDTEIATIVAKTNLIPASPAATSDIPTSTIQEIIDLLTIWTKNRAIFTDELETYYENNGTAVAFTQALTKTGVQVERGAAVE